MQSQSFLTELIQFKDEIFKTIRLLENKLTKDITDKYAQINLIFESYNNRLNVISGNNDSLLEILASQKLNLTKMNDIERINNKIENSQMTHDMKIKQIFFDIEKLKEKYDKIINDNFLVTGYIGPGCQYKTMSEYILNNILEVSKLKNDKEKTRMEYSTIKTKLDNILKSNITLIDTGLARCQKYTDRKFNDIKNILENKFVEINDKNNDLKALIDKNESDNGKIIENLTLDLTNLQKVKEEFILVTQNKIEEINIKIDNMKQDIKSLKALRKEKHYLTTKKNSKINDPLKFSEKNLNNVMNNNNNNNNNNINKNEENNIIKENLKENINKSKSIVNEEEKNSFIISEDENPKNKNNNKMIEIIKENKNIYQKNIMDNILLNEKSYDKKNIDENPLNKKVNITKINKNIQEENNNNINIKLEQYANNNIYQENREIKENKTYILNNDRYNSNNKYNKGIMPEKIKIESLEKQKLSLSNNSKKITLRKKEEEQKSLDILNIQNKSNDNNIIEENNIDNINNNVNIIMPEKEKNNYLKFSNLDLIRKMKEHKYHILTPSNSKSYYNISNNNNNKDNIIEKKPKARNYYLLSAEQKQIMDEIKTHFNIIKEKQEQRSLENIVDCNVINLQLDKRYYTSKKRTINTTTKIALNKNRKNMSEIGMKLSPAFGRTTYNFFIKNNKIGNSFENGLTTGINNNRINNLKKTLNEAFVNSIKEKINLNDKDKNNFFQ